MSQMGKEIIKALRHAIKTQDKGITLLEIPDIKKLRKELDLSQSEFSKSFRINIETLRAWEQGKRVPDSVSCAYLTCIEKMPKKVQQAVSGSN